VKGESRRELRMSAIWKTTVDTPVGTLLLLAEDDALVGVAFSGRGSAPVADPPTEPAHPVLAQARTQLGEYFAGLRTRFELPLRAQGTDFQRRVWAALAEIAYGETRSYSEIAARVEQPKAVRAVGAANGRNPVAIVIPCHRVIGADGSLTGYGGGTAVKGWLLRHERAVLASRGSSGSQTQFWASPSDSPPRVPRRQSANQSS
jgi:methylated-DNA-[protein]-cysteine S-methyltransferase